MASQLSLSLSESIHASVILQHQQQRKHIQKQPQPQKSSERESSEREFPIYLQFLLVAAFAGMEFSVAFTFIYCILFLQFIGVPSSMVSIGGILGGGSTVLFLPVTAKFTDKGSNLVRRKMTFMMISYMAFALGFIGLIVCSMSKLDYLKTVPGRNGTHGDDDSLHRQNNISVSDNFTTTKTTITETTSFNSENISTENTAAAGLIGWIGIISFGLLDFAFDTSAAFSRAFVLECSPSFMHTKLLVMVTILASVAGFSLSLVGTIDFPAILGSKFGVDGTAATMFMFSCSLLLIITLCYACTVITGYYVSRRFLSEPQITGTTSAIKRRQHSKTIKTLNTSDVVGDKPTDPLLTDYNTLDDRSYSALLSTPALENIDEENNLINHGFDDCISESLHNPHERNSVDVTMDHDCDNNDSNVSDYDTFHRQQVETGNVLICNSKIDNEHDKIYPILNEENAINFNKGANDIVTNHAQDQEVVLSGQRSTMKSSSYSHSMSHLWTQSNEEQQKSLNQEDLRSDNNAHNTANQSQTKLWKNKGLMVLCASLFFSTGIVILFNGYSGNTLTIGIYHADPTSLPGTKGRESYDKGLRSAALGSLLMYIMFAVGGLLNRKGLGVVDEKIQFTIAQTILIVTFVVFVVIQKEEVFFVSSCVVGLYRANVYTVCFVLAHRYAYEENAGIEDGVGKQISNVGQVMTFVGIMMPLQYVFLSCMVGPLIGSTGSAWVPMDFCIIYSIFALLIFSSLFVIKR